jgi:hypothetical protein
MTTPVTIGNRSLAHFTRSTIESLTEQSVEAREVLRWYDVARKQVLESHNWGFARKTRKLALASAEPTSEWRYQYQFPVDCLVPRYLVRPEGRRAPLIPFQIGVSPDGLSKVILTDLPEAEMVYTRDVTEMFVWTHTAINAMTYLLGHYMVNKLSGDKSLRERLLETYFGLIRMAEAQDGNAQLEDLPPDASWIKGR